LKSHVAGIELRNWEYRDQGCNLHPTSCLTCPFSKCQYEYVGGLSAFLRAQRDESIRVSFFEAGAAVETLAEQHILTERTIRRIIGT
jgi:hypothetical protein